MLIYFFNDAVVLLSKDSHLRCFSRIKFYALGNHIITLISVMFYKEKINARLFMTKMICYLKFHF